MGGYVSMIDGHIDEAPATDREKLIALIRECNKFHEEVKEKWILGGKQGEKPSLISSLADHLIANGVTFQQWIPVTERLPEAQGYYMVYHKNSKIAAERFYYKDCPDLFVAVTGDPVTHWMPQPQPPKEVE